jgi:hypothetical protein
VKFSSAALWETACRFFWKSLSRVADALVAKGDGTLQNTRTLLAPEKNKPKEERKILVCTERR